MNHDGEITPLLPLMAAKKDIKDIASSLLESIQATGIPSRYSSITTRVIRLKWYMLVPWCLCILCHAQKPLACPSEILFESITENHQII